MVDGRQQQTSQGRLATLPGEIIAEIALNIERTKDLASFVRTSMWTNQQATHILWRRNANHHDSYAIWYAVVYNDSEMVRVTIEKTLAYGGTVNCIHGAGPSRASPLHIAAGRGELAVVDLLLSHGASTSLPAQNLCGLLGIDIASVLKPLTKLDDKTDSPGIARLTRYIKRGSWLPLFLPVMRDFRQISRRLVIAGASGVLIAPKNAEGTEMNSEQLQDVVASRLPSIGPGPLPKPRHDYLSVLHVASLLIEKEEERRAATWIRIFRSCLEDAIPDFGGNALRLGLLCRNETMIKALTQRGMSPNVRDGSHIPLVHEAIRLWFRNATWNKPRESYRQILMSIMDAGADLNITASDGSTPLICVFEAVR